jgi:RHS repeat-associated protein
VETNASGNVTGTRTHDAFGVQHSSTGTPTQPFGFAGSWGYQEDQDSGFKLLGHRLYDPSIARFLSRDPARAGRNWWSYSSQNPLSSIDLAGLEKNYNC